MKTFPPPILFIIFNRIDTTEQVFEAIKKVKPERLYIAADGPRPDVQDDILQCEQTRKITERIDWPCQLFTLFRNENLGTKYGIVAALNWFFEHEEEGIILEHDCLPGDQFFEFCAQLLAYYRHDPRIMHITGNNLQFGQVRGNASYYFSAIPNIWGWASWRRVWNLYDTEMEKFPKFEEEKQMINVFPDKNTADWVSVMAKNIYDKKIKTWDYPLAFAIGINNGLCIVPNVNLASNIGFGAKAIHTKDTSHAHANVPIVQMESEIKHAKFFIPNRQADNYQLQLTINNVKGWQARGEKNPKKLNIFERIKRKLF